jgi:two-component system, NarL family, sensor histidine kinase UhpB
MPRRKSLLSRIFAVNAAVLATAVGLLLFTPLQVHAHTRLSEAITLLAGLALMLVADLVLVHRALAPLRRLVGVMTRVEAMKPGQRAPAGGDREMAAMSRAFNEMLDRLETERRESGLRALAAQEDERLRVARDLHDELGQVLTSVVLRAEYAGDHPDDQADALAAIAEATRASLDQVRGIARELRPEALDDLGLANALIALCRRVVPDGRPPVRCTLDPPPDQLAPEAQLVVYRVAQEALTNAVRHAPGASVELALATQAGDVLLSVRDDGPGFPPDRPEGAGLLGMRERALLIGAALTIDSGPGAGVRVALRVPLAPVGRTGPASRRSPAPRRPDRATEDPDGRARAVTAPVTIRTDSPRP